METLRSTLADVETALKDREKALSNVVKEKEEVTAAAKKTKEEMEGKVSATLEGCMLSFAGCRIARAAGMRKSQEGHEAKGREGARRF